MKGKVLTAKAGSKVSVELLQYAREHLLRERSLIDEKLAQIATVIGDEPAGTFTLPSPVTSTNFLDGLLPKRKFALSADAKRRISLAQKKRWVDYRQKQADLNRPMAQRPRRRSAA